MTSPAAWLVQHLGELARTQWQTTVQGLNRAEGGWLCLASDSPLGAPWQAAK